MSELKDLKVGDLLVIKESYGSSFYKSVVTKINPSGNFYIMGSSKCFNRDGQERTSRGLKMRAFRPDSQELADLRESARMSEMRRECYKVVDRVLLLVEHGRAPKHQAERLKELLVEMRDLLGIEI